MIETNHMITPINAPTIRGIYQEYLVVHTSNLRMLMSNHHSDNSIPIDESIEYRRRLKVQWVVNATMILIWYEFPSDTLDFIIERIRILI